MTRASGFPSWQLISGVTKGLLMAGVDRRAVCSVLTKYKSITLCCFSWQRLPRGRLPSSCSDITPSCGLSSLPCSPRSLGIDSQWKDHQPLQHPKHQTRPEYPRVGGLFVLHTPECLKQGILLSKYYLPQTAVSMSTTDRITMSTKDIQNQNNKCMSCQAGISSWGLKDLWVPSWA